MSDQFSDSRASLWQVALILLAGCAATAVVYRFQLLSGFAGVFGDRYDGMLSIAIMEHWHTVVTGAARRWHTTFYFHPVRGSLGYSEALAGLGLLHAAFRVGGVDPFLASELAALVLKAAGFFTFYWMARRSFAIPMGWSLFGAALFTISSNLFLGMVHTQFVALSLVPLIVVALTEAAEAIEQGQTWRWARWLMVAAAVFALCLTTCFYVAWYFVFFGAATAAAYAALGGWRDLRALVVQAGRHPTALAAVALWTGVCLYPFLRLYLPIIWRTGGHPAGEVLTHAPWPADILNVTPTNLVWSWLSWPAAAVTAGFTPAFLLTAVAGLVAILLWRPTSAQDRVLRAVALAGLATWPLVFRYGDWTPWQWVYNFFPGGKAVRVTLRYQYFLTAPLTLLAVAFIARLRLPAFAAVSIAAILLVEQVDANVPISIDRPQEMARLRAIPAPPAECRAFFATRPREGLVGRDAHGIYSHNVDAMVTAEWLRFPTINGFGTFTPPGWDLQFPSDPTYLKRVADYANRYKVAEGLCGFDFASQQWRTTIEP